VIVQADAELLRAALRRLVDTQREAIVLAFSTAV
jgi:hypothetical protein